jgi:uncharacterized protein (TIGR02453 family)
MLDIDPQFELKPPKKMISRIYRDLRFSKDKSPYRPNMWLSFHRATTDWKTDPTYFFELMPDHYRYGMGFSRPTKAFLTTLRTKIESHPEDFERMNELLAPNTPFQLMGTDYKRALLPAASISPELMRWYQKKDDIFVMATHPVDETVISSELITRLETDFKSIAPLYAFFWDIKQQAEEIARDL